jgi:hypothetical protein
MPNLALWCPLHTENSRDIYCHGVMVAPDVVLTVRWCHTRKFPVLRLFDVHSRMDTRLTSYLPLS